MMLAAFTEAPEAHYKAIVKAMSKRITFTSPSNKSPLTLAGNEELAFKDLDMAHILLLEGRAFGVNFFGSCSILFEELVRLLPSSPLPECQRRPLFLECDFGGEGVMGGTQNHGA